MATESVDEILDSFAKYQYQLHVDNDGSRQLNKREAKQRLDAYYTRESAKLEKAYGGCHNCYGKGYATGADLWSGVDTDQDIGSPGGTVSGGNPNAMKFCTCDRGKQLRERWASYTRECARKVLEIIGEDEDPDKRYLFTTHNGTSVDAVNKPYMKGRNSLRAELRAAIQEVGGGGE